MVLGIVASVVSLIKSTTGSVNVFGDVDVVRPDCIMPLASLGVMRRSLFTFFDLSKM